MAYLLALDQGTTSSRTLIINEAGEIVQTAQQEFKQYFPKPGWVEHDANEIYATQMNTLKQAVSQSGIDLSEIKGIGITNQRETTVLWNRDTGAPVHRAIVWQDRRTSDECESLKMKGLGDMVRMKTGLTIDAYFSATKISWILKHVEGAKALADDGKLLFGTIDSWLIWKMTRGQSHVTDHTNASRTMLFNIRTLQWDKELLNIFDVPGSILPEVKPSMSTFGIFDLDGHQLPISGVAGDQQAALFGQGCLEKGDAKNTYGTGCFLLMNQGNEMVLSENGLVTTLACSTTDRPVYALEGAVFIAGAAIQWLRDGLELVSHAAETEQLAESVQGNEVVMVPAFVGLGTPYWDTYARGAIFGLTRDTGKAHLARAALQSIAFQTRDVYEAMKKDSGLQSDTLKVDGGATANGYLMQFQADQLGVEVLRATQAETTALGAAYLAGVQTGVWSLEDVRIFSNKGNSFYPMMDRTGADQLYTQWQKAVSRTLGWLKDA